MPIIPARLGWTLALSILLHVAVIEGITRLAPTPAPRRDLAALDIRLREVPAQVQPSPPAAPVAPRLMLPKQSQPNASATRENVLRGPDGPPRGLKGEAALIAQKQLARALFYPREAIEQGIEGEATVLLFLDESGDAIAARLEVSSGHALLDDAAVRAARSLRALPGGAPREALLPVRFRLR